MFEFIWGCMIISFKGFLGMLFWCISISVLSFTIAVLVFIASGEWKTKKKWKEKRKYKGQPVVIKGGKEDE